jgi:WD40 repeat protein
MPRLDRAIAAIKAGDQDTGRQLLIEVLQENPRNELALLWISALTEDRTERAAFLEKVLAINPDNQAAQRGLALLRREDAATALPASQNEEVTSPQPPSLSPPQFSRASAKIERPPVSRPVEPEPEPAVQLTVPIAEDTLPKPKSQPAGVTDVFISYSRKDKPFVQKLYETLKANGREVWIDWGNIPLTADWRREIREGIERAGDVVFVLSPDFLASRECSVELEWAVELNKRLVPLVYRNVEPAQVPPALASLNWVFFRAEDDFEQSVQTLSEILDTDLDWVKAHTRLLVRAIEWDHNARNDSFLLRGKDLDEAERRLAQRGQKPEPTPLQGEYIFTSRRNALRRQRRILGAVTLAMLVSIVLAIVAYTQFLEARRQTALALQYAQRALSRQLAAQSVAYANDELDLALLLNLEAMRVADTIANNEAVKVLATLKASPYLTRFLHGHTDLVKQIAFSPDGRLMASVGRDSRVLLWEVAEGRPFGQPLTGHNTWVYAVAFSPDGQTLASGGIDGTILLWEVASGRQLGPPLTGHKDEISSLVFSPDGKTLASGGRDQTIFLWDVSTLSGTGATSPPPPALLTGHDANIIQLAFSPDGKTLISGGNDNQLIFWDLATRQMSGDPHPGNFEGAWTSLRFSPDGQTVASGGSGNVVMLWDATTGQPVREPLAGHTAAVYTLAFSLDGKILATAGDDRRVILWDVASGKALGPPLTGHAGWIGSLTFSPDNHTLASGSADNDIILWDTDAEEVLARHNNWVYSIAYSPDGQTLASGSYDHSLIFWDLAARQRGDIPSDQQLASAHAGPVRAVTYSPDGRILASGGEDKLVKLWDAVTHEPLGQPLSGHPQSLKTLAYSPDGRFLASGSADGLIILWDAVTLEPLGQLPVLHTNELDSVVFSPDSKLLASGSDDKTIILYDVATRQPLGPPLTGHEDWVNVLAFSPDGKVLASGSADNTIILWDLLTRQPLGPPLRGHTNRVWSLSFSPDGEILASGGADNSVILWDTEARQPFGAPLIGHTNLVRSLAFSPDGQKLASGSADNSVILWAVNLDPWPARACRIANRNLTEAEWRTYIGPEQPYQLTCPEAPSLVQSVAESE